MQIVLAFLLSYLLGSIPVGFIICHLVKGVDVRKIGSGNIGATNVARAAGKRCGIATLVLDILKGIIAVAFIPILFNQQTDLLKIACALSVICGHNWTIFLKFHGGKGVATTAGALIGLMPLVFLSSFCIWCIFFVIWRYVSLASIFAAVFLPIFLFLYGEPLIFKVLGIIAAVIGITRHKENIKRLIRNKEKRFEWK